MLALTNWKKYNKIIMLFGIGFTGEKHDEKIFNQHSISIQHFVIISSSLLTFFNGER